MKANMSSDDNNYPELSANDVLVNCQDFEEELGAMQSLIQSTGNTILFTSKEHPDIAGTGIEYDWEVLKKFFRRDTYHISWDHEAQVHLSLSKVKLKNSKNTSCKARSSAKAYTNKYCGSHGLTEKFVKISKCH